MQVTELSSEIQSMQKNKLIQKLIFSFLVLGIRCILYQFILLKKSKLFTKHLNNTATGQ